VDESIKLCISPTYHPTDQKRRYLIIVGGTGFAPMQIPKYQNVNHIPHFAIVLTLTTMETTKKVYSIRKVFYTETH